MPPRVTSRRCFRKLAAFTRTEDIWPADCSGSLVWSRHLLVFERSTTVAVAIRGSTRNSAYFDLARAVSFDPTVLNQLGLIS